MRDASGGVWKDAAALRCSMAFPGSTVLNARLVIALEDNSINWVTYSFHYMTGEGATIFRYDDADHHPQLENPPHHRHEGAYGEVFSCPRPSAHTIRNRITAYLERRSDTE